MNKFTEEEVRAMGWAGDITRFPLNERGIQKRLAMNGLTECPNDLWKYAPNAYVQKDLNDD